MFQRVDEREQEKPQKYGNNLERSEGYERAKTPSCIEDFEGRARKFGMDAKCHERAASVVPSCIKGVREIDKV